MLKCILIDDEPLALRQLRHYASQVSEIEVVAMFRSAIEAKEYISSEDYEPVDLIFCDINMPEMSGVELIREMQSGEDIVLPMVIFTTAYAEYAVEGFRLDAVDYLLKPFSADDFKRSVNRANSLYELRHGRSAQGESESLATVIEQPTEEQSDQVEYISVKADYKVTMIRLTDIIYIESEGEYVRIHIEGQRPITTFCRLKNMEAQLPDSQFIRVHRSYIININRVYSYDRSNIFISKSEYLPIGQNYRAAFQQRMTQRDGVLTI